VPWKCDDSGAAAVSVKNADFTPSSYDHTLTMDDSAQVEPLATGTTKVKVGNLGATGEPIRVAFGASEQNAEDNLTVDTGAATTGHYIPAIADAGSEAFQVLGVPALATHFAVCNAVASDTQVVVVTQGV
jgi:hypothetical protein